MQGYFEDYNYCKICNNVQVNGHDFEYFVIYLLYTHEEYYFYEANVDFISLN